MKRSRRSAAHEAPAATRKANSAARHILPIIGRTHAHVWWCTFIDLVIEIRQPKNSLCASIISKAFSGGTPAHFPCRPPS